MSVILIADDNVRWLTDTADFLSSKAGYTVKKASTYAETKSLLIEGYFDIAIIDIRLVSDKDSGDTTGLELARNYALHKPKIIVTAHANFGTLRDALRSSYGLPVGVDFVAKSEGLPALLSAIDNVERAINEQSRRFNLIFGKPINSVQIECDVFVIMPFAKIFDKIAKVLVDEVSKDLKMTVKRGDNFYTGLGIMQEIWTAVVKAEYIISDCTGRNPNVFYELGLVHALGKQVIMITQDINDIPFDIRHLRIVEYKNTVAGRNRLKENIVDLIKRLKT